MTTASTDTDTMAWPAPEPESDGGKRPIVGTVIRVVLVVIFFFVVYGVFTLIWGHAKTPPKLAAPAKDVAARLAVPGQYAHDVAAPVVTASAVDLTSCQSKYHAQTAGREGDVRGAVSLTEVVVRFDNAADATSYVNAANACSGATSTPVSLPTVAGASSQSVSSVTAGGADPGHVPAVQAHVGVGSYVIDVEMRTATGTPTSAEVATILTDLTTSATKA
jgi:hypothetical protein